jgi:hypothetical protein
MRLLAPLLLLFSAAAFAGGDNSSGKISEFSGKDGNFSFQFVETGKIPLVDKCPKFTVRVRYERVPWYSWLPFVETSHPTRKETDEAGEFIRNAFQGGAEIKLGYIGSGLVPDGAKCSFASRGLVLAKEPTGSVVLSFHDPV